MSNATADVSYLVAGAIVLLGIAAALLEVYCFRIRKRRRQGPLAGVSRRYTKKMK